MDLPSRISTVVDATYFLSETIDPLFRMVGGGAGFGIALTCAFEAMRDEPRWDRATGYGAAGGAAVGGLVLLCDIFRSW